MKFLSVDTQVRKILVSFCTSKKVANIIEFGEYSDMESRKI